MHSRVPATQGCRLDRGGCVERFDVIIIGSGGSGQTVAAACAKAGKRVVVIDREPFGGTCARCGCDPKKILLAAAEAVTRTEALIGTGVEGVSGVSWPELITHKRQFTDPVPERVSERFADMGVELISGVAEVTGDIEVSVGGRRLAADDLVIATGARPRTLDIVGEQLLTSSAKFMDLDDLPQRIVFAGGGYISFEFAELAARAGADVTIIHRSSRVLEGFDSFLASKLVDRYRLLGIRVFTDVGLEAVVRTPAGELLAGTSAGDITADLVVHGAGRVPNVHGMGLELLGVEVSERGVVVESSLRSTAHPHVWAVGDAAALGLPLTPVAGRQGAIAAANILGAAEHFDGTVTPSVAFTDPPLAAVGMSAEEALKDPARFEVLEHDTSEWFTQKRLGMTHCGARIVIDREADRILGAHLLGMNADELINIFALAMHLGATRAALKEGLWSYPTATSDLNYLL